MNNCSNPIQKPKGALLPAGISIEGAEIELFVDGESVPVLAIKGRLNAPQLRLLADILDSKEAENMGYTQLIDSATGEVLAQRDGNDIDYCKDKVWQLRHGQEVVFVQNSEYLQPNKFYRPLLRGDEVKIYFDITDDVAAEPKNRAPDWVGTVQALEDAVHPEMGNAILAAAQLTWDAYYNGEWIGTSEY